MLKKMRWRFIGAAMGAFTAVILVLSCAVNLWNYHITISQQDATLDLLQQFDDRKAPPLSASGNQAMPGPLGGFSPEMQYMTRFFTVDCDAEGTPIHVGQDHIASVSRADAVTYAQAVLSKGHTRGYYRNFRYLAASDQQGITTIIFLNAEREIQSMKALVLVTAFVAIGSVLAVFLLVFFLSKRAIEPYIRNIETQKRFITDAGHELKTPLTAISTSADLLALEYKENEWVQNIQSQSLRLSKLIANLVTLSRLDEEQPFPEKSNFSLSDAVWEIAEPIKAIAEAKGKVYTQNIEDGLMLQGDRTAIQQVVSILLDNAIKYSDAGGAIRLTVRKCQRKAVVTVYNTCTQIDTKNIERLFDRFYRPDASRSKQTGGTGLGLSIAKITTEAQGGRITVESQDGRDITFTVFL